MTINLQYMKLPSGMHGACTPNEDMSYTIFIDPNDSHEAQIEGYLHELEHIKAGDFDRICDKYAGELEVEAHKKTTR